MFKKVITLIGVLLFIWIASSRAQHIGINNNLLFDLSGSLSAGVEVPISKSMSIEAYGSIRPWKRAERSVHKHWLVQT